MVMDEFPWEDAVRTVVVENSGWMKGREISAALGQVRAKARMCDESQTSGSLQALAQALEVLSRETDVYARHVRAFAQDVGALAAAVHAEQSIHVDQPYVAPGVPAPDEMLERLSDLYGLPKSPPR
jgi:hypothetical protein